MTGPRAAAAFDGSAQGAPQADGAPLVIGFDLGSSAAKVVVATQSGTVLARRSSPQRVERPAPGLAEQDARDWWATFCHIAREAVGSVGRGGPPPIAAVAISAHFPTLLVADRRGRPLAPAMLYADVRAAAHIREGNELVGLPLLGDELILKLLWLRERAPLVFRRIGRIFGPQDYLAYRLTGAHVLDHHTASRYGGLLDTRRLEWRSDLVDRLGLATTMLPRLQRSGSLVGTVTAPASVETGIPAGTPVVTGVGDTLAELIGAGVVHQGEVLLYYGTTATVDVCTQDIEAYFANPRALASGAPYREVAYALIGPALPWAASGFDASDRGLPLEALDRAAAELPTTIDGPFVLPFFVERPPSDAPVNRPAIVGFDLGHGRAHLHRAIMESFGYVAKAGLEGVALVPTGWTAVAAGGGAGSGTWRQIVTDVLGADQRWNPDSDGALGDAMLAAWASGAGDTFGAGLARWGTSATVTRPDPEAVATHEQRYRVWRRLVDGVTKAYGTDVADG